MPSNRNPRINIKLADSILAKLERYAESRGEKPATEATYLLTKILDELEARGKIPAESPPADEFGERAKRYVKALALGEKIDVVDLAKLANDLGVETERLAEPLKRRGRVTNGH